MKPEEINRRIALACGWEPYFRAGVEWWISPKPDYHHCMGPLNYYENLNAMYNAESYIMDETSIEYEKWLRKFSCVWHVKASKKAEAFLRAINQWEEEELDAGDY